MSHRNRAVRALNLSGALALVGLSTPLLLGAVLGEPHPSSDSSLISQAAHSLTGSAPKAIAEPPEQVRGNYSDLAGLFSPEQAAEFEAEIARIASEHGLVLVIATVNDFDGLSDEEFGAQVWQARGGYSNSGVFAIDPVNRNVAAWLGSDFPLTYDDVIDAAYSDLANSNYEAAVLAALDSVDQAASGQAVPSADDSTVATDSESDSELGLALGLAGAGALGAGGWAYSRKQKRKRLEEEVARGRDIDPKDVAVLDNLSTEALDKLAREEIVSTDESISKAETELELARSEFGESRVREFTGALEHSRRTLRRAFEIVQLYDDKSYADDLESRSMLLEVISTCGTADDQLEAQAENFQQLRRQLLNADTTLAALTQRSVALHHRLPEAQTQLEELAKKYNAVELTAIANNVEMARTHLDQADSATDTARQLSSLPVGQQGQLIDAIAAADLALTQADRLLSAIETADSDIAAAVANLNSLVVEVQEEIAEATRLLNAPSGANIDSVALRSAVDEAQIALERTRDSGQRDPLSAWTVLTDADDQLDEVLDSARTKAASYARAAASLRHGLQDAENHIHAASDLISTRRHVVKASARTRLAEAQRAYEQAIALAEADPRRALSFARRARKLAAEAARLARRDIDRYEESRRNRNRGSGSMIAGMVIGSMLSNGGGFGGSSSFGGFSGGGFSGGAGGGRAF